MRYSLFIVWNGTPVMQARCSSVMAYETLKTMADNFVSPVKAGFVLPSLDTLVEAPLGTTFANEANDGTGACAYSLTVIA